MQDLSLIILPDEDAVEIQGALTRLPNSQPVLRVKVLALTVCFELAEATGIRETLSIYRTIGSALHFAMSRVCISQGENLHSTEILTQSGFFGIRPTTEMTGKSSIVPTLSLVPSTKQEAHRVRKYHKKRPDSLILYQSSAALSHRGRCEN